VGKFKIVGHTFSMMETTRVDSRGRIVLPRSVRAALGVKPGDVVVIQLEGDRAVLRKACDPEEVLEKLLGDLTFSRELRRAAERMALEVVESEPRGDRLPTRAQPPG